MPKSKEDPEEIDHRELALQVVDLFFPALPDDQDDNDQKILDLLAKLDPVDASAVAVEVCLELSPEEISEFLDLLENGPVEDAEEEEKD